MFKPITYNGLFLGKRDVIVSNRFGNRKNEGKIMMIRRQKRDTGITIIIIFRVFWSYSELNCDIKSISYACHCVVCIFIRRVLSHFGIETNSVTTHVYQKSIINARLIAKLYIIRTVLNRII